MKGAPATNPAPFGGNQPSSFGFGGGAPDGQQKTSFSFASANAGPTEAQPFVFGASGSKPVNPIEEMPVGGSEANFGFRVPPPKNERFGGQNPVEEDDENEDDRDREEPRGFGGFRGDDASESFSPQPPALAESPRQSHVFPGGQVENDDDDDERGDEVAHWMPQDDSGSGDNGIEDDEDEDDDKKLAERFGF